MADTERFSDSMSHLVYNTCMLSAAWSSSSLSGFFRSTSRSIMRRWESGPAPILAATRFSWSTATCSDTSSSSTQVRSTKVLVELSSVQQFFRLLVGSEPVLYSVPICASRGEELHLWPVWSDLQTEETPLGSPNEAFRSQATAVSTVILNQAVKLTCAIVLIFHIHIDVHTLTSQSVWPKLQKHWILHFP